MLKMSCTWWHWPRSDGDQGIGWDGGEGLKPFDDLGVQTFKRRDYIAAIRVD